MEIERKWLLSRNEKECRQFDHGLYLNTKYLDIVQGYIDEDVHPDGPFRIRKIGLGEVCYKTVKQGKGLVRSETETIITDDEFESLWPLTKGKTIKKNRYPISYYFARKGYTIELDVFLLDLSGLILVEVEFDSVEEAQAFIPPAWFGEEVTDDERYTNYSLACNGLPSI